MVLLSVIAGDDKSTPKHANAAVAWPFLLLLLSCNTTMEASDQTWKESNNVRDHFTVVRNGNNSIFFCKWCPASFSGSATRAYTHLTGQQAGSSRKGSAQCPAVPERVRQRLIAAKSKADAENTSKKRSADVSVDQLERAAAFERVNVSGPSSVASGTNVSSFMSSSATI
jgi:hypothetical protein